MLRPIVLAMPLILGAVVASRLGFPATNSGPRGWLLVANKGDQTLGIIDPAAGKQVAAVPEGGVTGHEVIASPDGKFAYVPIYGNSGVGKPGTDGKSGFDLIGRRSSPRSRFRGTRSSRSCPC